MGPLGQSTATAAANVNAWSGTASLLPLLGAFLADSFLGRFRMVIIPSVLYILGLGCLSLSAVIYSSVTSDCQNAANNSSCAHPWPNENFSDIRMRMNGLTGQKMQKIFKALVPESVYNDPRNLVEYSCFRFLSRNSSDVHPGLKIGWKDSCRPQVRKETAILRIG